MDKIGLLEGKGRTPKNDTAFFSCVGRFEEAIQCPAGAVGQVRYTSRGKGAS